MSHAHASKVLLGLSGSIAAYKGAELARLLVRAGHDVHAVMTRAATRFLGPATLLGITGNPVSERLFDGAPGERHVELARAASLFVIAPATADLLARLASGRANDVVSATALCFEGPLFVAPAMHPRMWQHPATQRNVEQLRRDGVHVLGPAEGQVASGDAGFGRMLEPMQIVEALSEVLSSALRGDRPGSGRDLEGRRIVVSAGPTLEDLDPVRFIGNRSSGAMGYALAAAARDRGAHVELVSGPTHLAPLSGVRLHPVRSAEEMLRALRHLLEASADAVVMAAAVGDFRTRGNKNTKIKRAGALTLELEENPDVIATLSGERTGPLPVLVAFAVETGDDAQITELARAKLERKGVEMIVANSVAAFASSDNRVQIITRSTHEQLPSMSKTRVAHEILDRLTPLWQAVSR